MVSAFNWLKKYEESHGFITSLITQAHNSYSFKCKADFGIASNFTSNIK